MIPNFQMLVKTCSWLVVLLVYSAIDCIGNANILITIYPNIWTVCF